MMCSDVRFTFSSMARRIGRGSTLSRIALVVCASLMIQVGRAIKNSGQPPFYSRIVRVDFACALDVIL